MAEPAGTDVRYTAFLSYSHKDAAAAARLHRRLEAYRVPKRLVGAETPRGPVPRRLWPIFRDREELPAASDLSETVRSALAESGALIILCSPSAAESLWVAEEIETFRRLHPGRPILAAILGGDPPDCFPKALRAFGRDGTWHEPLATDLRPGRDGRHLGLLKLVAGITGLGLDDLVQRDASRRVRRVTTLGSAALIAMMVMAALAILALTARGEAERQRNEAEGLARFMLTDLRERLRGVGRLDVMRAVDARALEYHNRQLALYDRPADRIMRARVLQAIGEDEIAAGHLDIALTSLREAATITADELARAPNDPERVFDQGRSEYWIGHVAELRADWTTAQAHYTNFAQQTQHLMAIAPGNPEYIMEIGWSAFDLGNIHLGRARDFAAKEYRCQGPTPPQPLCARPGAARYFREEAYESAGIAQPYFERAVSWFEQAARRRPSDEDMVRARANAYAALADTFFMRQMWVASLAARSSQNEIVERLYRADLTNLQNAFRFGIAERALGVAFAKVGDVGHALRHMVGAYDLAMNLSRQDRGNAEWVLFRTQVACEFYYRNHVPSRRDDLGFPDRVTRTDLADDIRAMNTILARENDPRRRDVSGCLNGLGAN